MKETEELPDKTYDSVPKIALDCFQHFEEIFILTFTKRLLRFKPTATRKKYGSPAAPWFSIWNIASNNQRYIFFAYMICACMCAWCKSHTLWLQRHGFCYKILKNQCEKKRGATLFFFSHWFFDDFNVLQQRIYRKSFSM